jgi:hypothetical protein
MLDDKKKLELIKGIVDLAQTIVDNGGDQNVAFSNAFNDISFLLSVGDEEDESLERDPIESLFVANDSSWIEEFQYDNDTEELTMITQSGNEYVYLDVTSDLWADLKNHIENNYSAGEFFNEYIKGQYERG